VNEISIHETSGEQFIDRLHDAFLTGDDAPALKSAEAGNVRRLQDLYRALAQGDFSPLIAALAEDSELHLHGPANVPINGSWRGHAEVVAAVRRNFGMLAEQQAEILSVVAQGDTVVLFAEERGKVRATGLPYHVRWVQLFTFRDNKLVRVQGVTAQLAPTEG
jgi:ketosteroid isomerase-like protein